MSQKDPKKAIDLVSAAKRVVIIQAENPDADSLGSAAGLENILLESGKEVYMMCPVDIPRHLRYIKGWERVENELPGKFDLSIVVDTSAGSLLEKVFSPENTSRLQASPMVVIDHHDNRPTVQHSEPVYVIDPKAVATAQVIYDLAEQADWTIDHEAATALCAAMMSDSLGFTSLKTTGHSLRIVASMLDKQGVSPAEIDTARRDLSKKTIPILKYKAELIKRIEFYLNDRLALVTIPLEEIETYSDQYNPSILALEELRSTEKVDVSVAIKNYGNKITGKLRCSYTPVCDKIAEHFGGGGHPFAAGFKTREWTLDNLKKELIQVVEAALK